MIHKNYFFKIIEDEVLSLDTTRESQLRLLLLVDHAQLFVLLTNVRATVVLEGGETSLLGGEHLLEVSVQRTLHAGGLLLKINE